MASNPIDRGELTRQSKRLDYAVLQLAREAKFRPKWNRENERFHRGFDTLVEVRDALYALLEDGNADS